MKSMKLHYETFCLPSSKYHSEVNFNLYELSMSFEKKQRTYRKVNTVGKSKNTFS
jgi:hypothetical protein